MRRIATFLVFGAALLFFVLGLIIFATGAGALQESVLIAPPIAYDLGVAAYATPLAATLINGWRQLAESRRARRRRVVEEVGLNALIAALDARDHYTGDHSAAVVELAGAVARRMMLSRSLAMQIEQVALLHDVGKIGVPDAILRKCGPLTDDEWTIMKLHPAIGARVVTSIKGLEHLAPAIRAEHERWDGCGYPDGLAGRAIPLASRIILACDAYHAMISDRPYRRAIPREAAVKELLENAGKQFCPDTVAALVEIVCEEEAAA